MSLFKIVFFSILIIIIVVAVLITAGVIGGGGEGPRGGPIPLTIWGTLPKSYFSAAIDFLNKNFEKQFILTYQEKDKDNYDEELMDSLSTGEGPDLWLLSQETLLKHKKRILTVPFGPQTMTQRDFKDSFIDISELFTDQKGILGMPLLVDPLVLFWNKDLFNKAGLSSSPRDWDEFTNYSQELTKIDESGNILESGAALGEFGNINNAKELISLLILQTGNPIVDKTTLDLRFGEKGTAEALGFYTEFSDPVKLVYSWNKSFASSKERFIAGRLAMYFGYASEYEEIKAENPHLNFDVAPVPQIKDAKTYIGFGRIYALVISRFSSQPKMLMAFRAAKLLASSDSEKQLVLSARLPAARRDLASISSQNAVLENFYKAALQSRSWLEPEPERVSVIFENMIQSITTGRRKISEAMGDAERLLGQLLAEKKKELKDR
jgi:multiple sugar transport system substrate-binding protein